MVFQIRFLVSFSEIDFFSVVFAFHRPLLLLFSCYAISAFCNLQYWSCKHECPRCHRNRVIDIFELVMHCLLELMGWILENGLTNELET